VASALLNEGMSEAAKFNPMPGTLTKASASLKR